MGNDENVQSKFVRSSLEQFGKFALMPVQEKKLPRGQVLFQIDPDIPPVSETEEELFKRQQKKDNFLNAEHYSHQLNPV
ncbi:MAG: hypothetical protein Ct9H300mP21_11170 [Pseudomonadota bacterium]|nr:MAG: hypothetical protein Ct9H300mP21_11170 [Pseudomonadota bacterium]